MKQKWSLINPMDVWLKLIEEFSLCHSLLSEILLERIFAWKETIWDKKKYGADSFGNKGMIQDPKWFNVSNLKYFIESVEARR